MSFCTQCGEKLSGAMKFCANCGAPSKGTRSPYNKPASKQNKAAAAPLHCPNCGRALKALEISCAACGYEVRDESTSVSVREFAKEYKRAAFIQQRIRLVRSFPIPNTKEGIAEFLVLSLSNYDTYDEQWLSNDESKAWLSKIEQCYHKAEMLFQHDADFRKIQGLYNQIQDRINSVKRSRDKERTFKIVLKNVTVICGVIALIIAVIIDKADDTSSMIQIIGVTLLIISASTLQKRGASLLDYGIAAGSGLLTVLLSFLLHNGSMFELGGGVVLIITAVRYFQSMGKGPKA